MLAFLRTIDRIIGFSLAAILPVVGLAVFGYVLPLALTMPKPASWLLQKVVVFLAPLAVG